MARAMTIAEKILSAHTVPKSREEVKPGEYLWAKIDFTFGGPSKFLEKHGIEQLGIDPDRVLVVNDHLAPPSTIRSAEQVAAQRRFVKKYGITHWYEYGRHGICHQIAPESGMIVPGMLTAHPDSHSTSEGWLNAASTNSAIDSIYILVKGIQWFRVPQTIRFWLTGKLPKHCVGKDVILKIAGDYGTDVALYRSVEFVGPLAHEMSTASRWTMSNMGVEIGAKFAIFEADQKTYDFLKGRTKESYHPVESDPDAEFERVIEVDVSELEPQVACPHDVGNVRSVTELEKEGIKINQGFIGSCTNSRQEDLEMAAKILEGNKVHPDVRLIISPASMEVWRDALRAGWLETFVEADGLVCHPTCGPCYGGHMGILAAGERCISASNRNFQGRQGSPESEVYLANAATVAASALAGYIVDPRKYV